MSTEKYQWALYIKGLPKDKLKALIEGLRGNISLNINVRANEGMLKYAQKCLYGESKMVKCEECGKEVGEDYYHGFMLLGMEYEFEDKIRCNSCTEKAKWEFWNETVLERDDSNICEICPFESQEQCIIYGDWAPDSDEIKMFGKMEDHPCFKRICNYFLSANDIELDKVLYCAKCNVISPMSDVYPLPAGVKIARCEKCNSVLEFYTKERNK